MGIDRDQVERQLEQLFAGYEVTELSVSTLPEIIRDIALMMERTHCEEAPTKPGDPFEAARVRQRATRLVGYGEQR